MNNETPRISAEKIFNTMKRLLMQAGMPEHHAELNANAFLIPSLRGTDTHGIRTFGSSLGSVIRGTRNIAPDIRPVTQLGNMEVWDADNAVGQVAGGVSMERAIELAAEHGLGWVMIRGSNHHGACSAYSMMAVNKGYVAVSITNSGPAMAVEGSVSRTIGNNPFSIGAPGPDFPVVLDMALSTVSGMKVIIANQNEQPIPEGWLVKEQTDGEPWILTPLGGPKGSGLAIMMEVLTGVLSGGGILWDLAKTNGGNGQWTHTHIVIDPRRLMPDDQYDDAIRKLVTGIKSAEKAPGVDEILLPGERAYNESVIRSKDGIPVTDEIRGVFEKACESVGTTLDW
jgi:LDH2 family malate/lactate/ureidoglycolate dehydrogenase